MRPDRAFHLYTVAVVTCSVGAIETAAGPGVFMLGTLLVCAFYYFNETAPRTRNLPSSLANILCVIAFFVTMFTAFGTREGVVADVLEFRIPLIARFLIFTQWVMLLRQRSNRDYTWLYFMSLTLIAGSALLMPDLPFAVLYVVFMVLLVAALRLFTAKQELEALGRTLAESGRPADAAFFGRCLAGTTVFLIPVALVFMVLPRGRPGALAHTTRRPTRPITGFSEAVQLGDIVRIQQSSSRVMQVQVTDLKGQRQIAPNLLMRGMAFDYYDGRRWQATSFRQATARRITGRRPLDFRYRTELDHPDNRTAPTIVCDVALEPLDSRVLFAPYAISSLGTQRRTGLRMDLLHDTVRTQYERRGVLKYKVTSRLVGRRPPEVRTQPVSRRRDLELYLQLPSSLPTKVAQLAQEICRSRRPLPAYDRARRVEEYLSDASRFTYSLEMRPTPRKSDPIEDFLFESRNGHCEFYASAMVILLRAVQVPARLVNGFKGGEWNEYGQYVTFRHRDAHSWVEAYVAPVGWMTFDPTPAATTSPVRRSESVVQKGRNLLDFLDRAWIEYVVGYNKERQSVVYRVLKKPALFVKNVLVFAMWHVIGEKWLARGASGELWNTVWQRTRGVTVSLLIGAGVLVILLLVRRVRIRRKRRLRDRKTVAFYEELLGLLRRRGFTREKHVTPVEFAEQVMASDGSELAGVGWVTRCFCRIRYGGRDLTEAEVRKVRATLDAIRRPPQPSRQGGK